MHFGKRLVGIEKQSGGNVVMTFADGSMASADCLIGADGIHSRTRRYLLGEDHPAASPKDQGWVMFRRMVPIEEARQKVEVRLLNKVPIYCGNGGVINCRYWMVGFLSYHRMVLCFCPKTRPLILLKTITDSIP
jgi:salicylate hydroxylase